MRKWLGCLAVVAIVMGMFSSVAHADPREKAKTLIQEWGVLDEERVRLDEEGAEIAKLEEDLNARLVAVQKTEAALKAEEAQIKSSAAVQAWMQKSVMAQAERKAIMEGAFVRVEKRTKLNADSTVYQAKKQDWLRRAQLFLSVSSLGYPGEDDKVNVDCAKASDISTARACLKRWEPLINN
jgi:hypothetical protein